MTMSPQKVTGYYGTYATPESQGLYRFDFDPETGRLENRQLAYPALDCKYLSCHGSTLACPVSQNDRAGLCLLELDAGAPLLMGTAMTEGVTANYVTQDDDYVYTANYHEGGVLIYKKETAGPRLVRCIETGAGSGCHQVLFHGHYLMAVCLLKDRIYLYDREREDALAGEIAFPKGTGPRHGIFSPDHRHLYVVSELSNGLFTFDVEDDSFRLTGKIPVLQEEGCPAGAVPASAAIRLGPEGRTLTVSTRGTDTLTVFTTMQKGRPTVVQTIGCGGRHPRDFIITGDGRFLLVANREQGGIVCFRRDPESGELSDIVGQLDAPQAVSLLLIEN